jgi:hypothetical protein
MNASDEKTITTLTRIRQKERTTLSRRFMVNANRSNENAVMAIPAVRMSLIALTRE